MNNPYVYFRLVNGIIVATYRSSANPITIDKAIIIRNGRLDFQDGRPYPVLVRTESPIFMEKAARVYFGGPAGVELILAAALLKQNALVEGVVNFFLAFMPESIPTKAFRREDAAFRWLNKYKTPVLIDHE